MNKFTLPKKCKYISKTKRSSNLELYRIIVMLLIVAHHYVVNSGLLEVMRQDPLSGRSMLASKKAVYEIR